MRFLRLAPLCALLAVAGCAVSEAQDFTNIAPGKIKDSGASETGISVPDGGEEDSGPGSTDVGGGDDTTAPGEDSGGGVDSTIADSGAPDTAPIDTGKLDTGTPDTGTPDTGTPDTGTPDTGIVDTGGAETGVTTITFPASTDTNGIKATVGGVYYMWQKGDFIQGTRTAGPSITSISGTFEVVNAIAPSPCGSPFPIYNGFLDINVTVNGTKVGAMKIISTSGNSVPISFTFPAITGPYIIRYEVPTAVAPYCGSVEVKFDVSKLTLK